MAANIHYFLCANSGNGLYSLCDEITKSEDTKFLYILKGGPGCGKSSFMKTVGKGVEKLGLDVEYIHCSADPNSLDGIVIPALGAAYLDGTAPHVLEPDYPGVSAVYLNLGEFYRVSELADKKDEVRAIFAEYKALYAKAYGFLSSAAKIGTDAADTLGNKRIYDTIIRRSDGICAREFISTGKEGKIKRRFLRAFTYDGLISRFDTVEALSKRVCTIDNELGFAPFMLRRILDCAVKCGYSVLLSPSPLFPEQPEFVIIPELSLAFLSESSASPYAGEHFKHVRLDALVDKDAYKKEKHALREEKRLRSALLEKAREKLAEAKAVHNELEAIYNPHVDFDGVYALARKHIELYK